MRLTQQCASLQRHTDQATAAPQTNNTTAEGLVYTNRAASLKPEVKAWQGVARQRIVQQETSPTLDHTMMNTTCSVARALILTG